MCGQSIRTTFEWQKSNVNFAKVGKSIYFFPRKASHYTYLPIPTYVKAFDFNLSR